MVAHVHWIQTGQSLSIGGSAGSTLTTTDPYPGILLAPTGAPAAFIDLVEPMPGADWESGGVAFAKALYEYVGSGTWSIRTHGHAATPYVGLKKGTTYYNSSMNSLAFAKTAALALGRTFSCGGVIVVHGENDMLIGTTRAAYEAFMVEWQSDYETDIKASTGQTGTVPMMMTQVASWAHYVSAPTTGLGQLDAHRNNPGKIIMVGPKYHLPYRSQDHIHLQPEGYYDLGEYHAKVAKALVAGTTWNPVAPRDLSISGTTITAKFHVPVSPLVFDTTQIAAQTNKGFSYTDDGGTVTISSVTLTANDTVSIVLSGTPGTNPRLRYGFSTTDFGNLEGGGGNLRDSDTYVGARGSRVLQNWCCHFDDPIPFRDTSVYANNFNGGTDTVTVSTANSGGTSGDAFGAVTIGGTSTLVYTAANSYSGGMAAAVDPASNFAAYVDLYTPGVRTDIYGRVYVRFPTLPAASMALVDMFDTGVANFRGRLTVETDGRMRLVNAAGTTVATTPNDPTGKIVANTWTRLEWHFVGNTTAGAIELKMYLTANAVSPSSTTTVTGTNTGGSVNRYRIGQTTGVATNLAAFYIDEIEWNTAGYPGPLGEVAPAVLDAVPVLFTPKANESVAGELISHIPALFTPSRGGAQVISGGGVFQADAFQGD